LDYASEYLTEGEDFMSSSNGNNGNNESKNTPQTRPLGEPHLTYQAFAAVLAGHDDEVGMWLEMMTIDELRIFHFQLDRIRTLCRNVRSAKMRMAEAQAKAEHEATVVRSEGAEE
jgi:hypothetical protein